jgi:hypothetical protein
VASAANESATKANCASAAGAAMLTSDWSSVRVPTIGIEPWISASPSASMSA